MLFRAANTKVGEYVSNDDAEIAHNGTLITKTNATLDDLKYSDESIVDIALNNGFPNIQAFNRTFKELFQMTPKQYRKKTRK